MSTSREPPLLSTLIGTALVSIAATAVATYTWTKQRETAKYQAIANRQYEREKMLKEKTAIARKEHNEPPAGTLVEDVFIDKIFLWECVDLRKRFPSAMTPNVMKIGQATPTPTIRSPLLRQASSNIEEKQAKSKKDAATTPYNKLISDHECILGDIVRKPNGPTHTVAYMRAGPRKLLHFDPKVVNAAIVTCGGLCPGLNNVVRELTKTLVQIYGIGGHVYGIQGGYRGFYDPSPHLQPLILTPSVVENIHHEGGTVLGSSRGGFDLEKIIDFMESKKISQLYVIGGDGTHRGAFTIHEGCMARGLNVAVAGIPKTIDNDVDYIDHSL
jgi:6-phosphofructokinase 1